MVGELKSAAEKLNAEIIMPDDLVNEVAALTEWPVVYESGFDEEFPDGSRRVPDSDNASRIKNTLP